MQKRKYSLVETTINVGSGIVISMFTWTLLIIPMKRILEWNLNEMALWQILIINLIFTAVSVIRGYFWRRVFVKIGRRIMGVG